MQKKINLKVQKQIVVSNFANVLGFITLSSRRWIDASDLLTFLAIMFFSIGFAWGGYAIYILRHENQIKSNTWQFWSACFRMAAAAAFMVLTILILQ